MDIEYYNKIDKKIIHGITIQTPGWDQIKRSFIDGYFRVSTADQLLWMCHHKKYLQPIRHACLHEAICLLKWNDFH